MSRYHATSPPRLARLVLAGLLAALLTACVQSAPQLDAHFGDAVRIARAQQVANPAAAANLDPVRGLDGRSAGAALERYQKSFVAPVQGNQSQLGGGGGK